MQTAYIFPGQGAQKVGMGRALYDGSEAARAVFAAADQALGFAISRLCFDGPAEKLELTAFTQPAILTVSVAAWEALREAGGAEPAMVAGHSLGEYAALVCSGALKFEDAVRLVHLRGRFMQEAVPPGAGAMAAILGLSNDEVGRLCQDVKVGHCAPANFNGATQVVVAGDTAAVDAAMALAETRGAKWVKKLDVSAPFHSSLMAPAAVQLQAALEKVELRVARFPVISNVEAAPYQAAGRIRELLVRQVTSPVRWEESVHVLERAGITHTVELGPGRVLSGLVRRIAPAIKTLNIEEPGQVMAAAGLKNA